MLSPRRIQDYPRQRQATKNMPAGHDRQLSESWIRPPESLFCNTVPGGSLIEDPRCKTTVMSRVPFRARCSGYCRDPPHLPQRNRLPRGQGIRRVALPFPPGPTDDSRRFGCGGGVRAVAHVAEDSQGTTNTAWPTSNSNRSRTLGDISTERRTRNANGRMSSRPRRSISNVKMPC